MVIIEKVTFPDTHQFRHHSIQIKRYHSQKFKAHKLTILCFFSFFADHQIFMTDSKSILSVISRLIRGDHSLLQHCISTRNNFPSEAIGSFMDIQKISYSMSGSMIKVQCSIPERLSCQNIQIYTGTAMKKSGSSQIQSSPQNCCEVLFLFLSSRPHDNSTGNISSSLFIMSSCICQKKAGWFQRNIRFGCCKIMYNSSMLSIGNNRIKTVIYEILLFRTEFIQLFCCT